MDEEDDVDPDADPDADDLQDPGIDAGQPEDGVAAGGPGVVGTETDDAATAADAPGGLDRFRSKVKPRSGGSAWREGPPMIDDATLAAMAAIRRRADLTTRLSTEFFPTAPFRDFQTRVFTVLEEREARLKAGFMEQKGAALLGPAGTGKSCMTDKVIMNFQAVAGATGGREFGDRIVSAIVPGRATVKDTLREILRQLGYPCDANRDEDYLTQRVVAQFEGQRVAALHLDEVQDSGRYATSDSMRMFSKKFRNLIAASPVAGLPDPHRHPRGTRVHQP